LARETKVLGKDLPQCLNLGCCGGKPLPELWHGLYQVINLYGTLHNKNQTVTSASQIFIMDLKETGSNIKMYVREMSFEDSVTIRLRPVERIL
jgi:hypothetical protein